MWRNLAFWGLCLCVVLVVVVVVLVLQTWPLDGAAHPLRLDHRVPPFFSGCLFITTFDKRFKPHWLQFCCCSLTLWQSAFYSCFSCNLNRRRFPKTSHQQSLHIDPQKSKTDVTRSVCMSQVCIFNKSTCNVLSCALYLVQFILAGHWILLLFHKFL